MRPQSNAATALSFAKSSFAPYPAGGGDPARLDTLLDTVRVTPVSAVGYDCTPAWHVAERVLPDSMWYWVESGRGGGYVRSAEESFTFSAGDLIVMPRGEAQSTWSAPRTDVRLYSIHFYADAFGGMDLCALLGLRGRLPCAMPETAGRASRELARLHALRPPGMVEGMRALVWEVLLEAVRLHAATMSDGPIPDAWPQYARIEPLLEWLRRNLHRPELSVAGLARQAHCSTVSLRRLFHAAMHESPVTVIRRARIERACALLKTGTRSIKEIAALCGFSSVPFFNRVFRETIGCAPGCYRRRREFDSRDAAVRSAASFG